MRKFFILSFLFVFQLQIIAQLTYQITVVDNQQNPMRGLPVVLKETLTKEKINLSTDGSGIVKIELTTGKSWVLSVGKIFNYKVLEVPESGKRQSREFMTYDLVRWEKENRIMPDRSKIEFTIVKKNIYNSTKATATESIVQLIIKRADKKPLTNYKVDMTSLKNKTIYQGKTDEQGIARFLLPIGEDYEIDIDGIESFKDMSISKPAGTEHYTFTYEPTNIQETNVNDTINQILPDDVGGTSARYLYTIFVKNKGAELLPNEPVYVRMLNSKKVYYTKTNDQGEAKFLLPKKNKYLVDLDYEKDINVIDLSQGLSGGIGAGEMHITYHPNPKLQNPEQFIPTVEELLINEFNNFLVKQYPRPEKGKAINIICNWSLFSSF